MEIREQHAQSQAEAEAELRRAEAYVEYLRMKVEAGKVFARTLAQIEPPRRGKHSRQSNGASVTPSLHAKNIGDVVYHFLRKHNAGVAPMKLYKQIAATGLHIGSSEYLYSVLKRLVRKDWVRKEGDLFVANNPLPGTPENALVGTRYPRNSGRSSYITARINKNGPHEAARQL
jgi:hypothetical protein